MIPKYGGSRGGKKTGKNKEWRGGGTGGRSLVCGGKGIGKDQGGCLMPRIITAFNLARLSRVALGHGDIRATSKAAKGWQSSAPVTLRPPRRGTRYLAARRGFSRMEHGGGVDGSHASHVIASSLSRLTMKHWQPPATPSHPLPVAPSNSCDPWRVTSDSL